MRLAKIDVRVAANPGSASAASARASSTRRRLRSLTFWPSAACLSSSARAGSAPSLEATRSWSLPSSVSRIRSASESSSFPARRAFLVTQAMTYPAASSSPGIISRPPLSAAPGIIMPERGCPVEMIPRVPGTPCFSSKGAETRSFLGGPRHRVSCSVLPGRVRNTIQARAERALRERRAPWARSRTARKRNELQGDHVDPDLAEIPGSHLPSAWLTRSGPPQRHGSRQRWIIEPRLCPPPDGTAATPDAQFRGTAALDLTRRRRSLCPATRSRPGSGRPRCANPAGNDAEERALRRADHCTGAPPRPGNAP